MSPKNNKFKRGVRRTHLDTRYQHLLSRLRMIESELTELEGKHYRTCIFGSARTKPEMQLYKDVEELARLLAADGIDILTGGGPGLMEAGNRGAQRGREEAQSKSRSIGISIELDFEPFPNPHLDVKRHHHRFSSRLDDFMRLSHSVICTPGGIGTVLELMFTWQLVQVKHIDYRPIVLMDSSYWNGLIDWMKSQTLQRKLVSPQDFDCITIVDTPEQAHEVIAQHQKDFCIDNVCANTNSKK